MFDSHKKGRKTQNYKRKSKIKKRKNKDVLFDSSKGKDEKRELRRKLEYKIKPKRTEMFYLILRKEKTRKKKLNKKQGNTEDKECFI